MLVFFRRCLPRVRERLRFDQAFRCFRRRILWLARPATVDVKGIVRRSGQGSLGGAGYAAVWLQNLVRIEIVQIQGLTLSRRRSKNRC